jgi:hypothetical protein
MELLELEDEILAADEEEAFDSTLEAAERAQGSP